MSQCALPGAPTLVEVEAWRPQTSFDTIWCSRLGELPDPQSTSANGNLGGGLAWLEGRNTKSDGLQHRSLLSASRRANVLARPHLLCKPHASQRPPLAPKRRVGSAPPESASSPKLRQEQRCLASKSPNPELSSPPLPVLGKTFRWIRCRPLAPLLDDMKTEQSPRHTPTHQSSPCRKPGPRSLAHPPGAAGHRAGRGRSCAPPNPPGMHVCVCVWKWAHYYAPSHALIALCATGLSSQARSASRRACSPNARPN